MFSGYPVRVNSNEARKVSQLVQLISQDDIQIKPRVGILEQVLRHCVTKRAYLVWRAFQSDEKGKIDKIPVSPDTGLATSPNSAGDRAILTFHEAVDAAARLRDEMGLPCGVGLLSSRADILAIDLDRCVKMNGDIKIDQWARDIVKQNYAELSPSRTGLRCLVSAQDFDPELLKRSNGHERMQLGIYGPGANRFVTLTGAIIEGAILDLKPMPEAQQGRIWTRWAQDKVKASSYGQFVGLYPAGRRGMDLALEDIITGASLHPATVAFASKAANYYSRTDVEYILHEAFDASDAKGTSRWAARYPKSINGVLKWLDQRKAFSPGRDVPTQLRQAAKAALEYHKAKKDKPPEPVSVEAGEGADYVDPVTGHARAGLTAEQELEGVRAAGFLKYDGGRHDPNCKIDLPEYEELAAAYGGPLSALDKATIHEFRVQWMLEKGIAADLPLDEIEIPSGLQETMAYTAVLLELEKQALVELRTPEQADIPYWMIDELPCQMMQDMAKYVLDVQRYEMPILAAMAAFSAVSAISQNAFAIKFSNFHTPLNLYWIGVAPSGSGKEAGRTLIREVGELVGDKLIGGKVASEAGLYDTVIDAGAQGKILLWDEVWALFDKLGQPNATHENGMLAVLLEMYTQGTGAVSTTARALKGNNNRPAVIHAPFVGVAGTTTLPRFVKAMTPTFLEDGLVGRTVFAVARRGPIKPVGHNGPAELPEGLYGTISGAVRSFRATSYAFGCGDLDRSLRMAVRRAGPTVAGKGFIRVGLTNERQCRLDQWSRDLLTEFEDESPLATAVGRAAIEQTLRIAGLLAVGRLIDTADVMGMDCLSALNEFGISIDDACLDYAMKVIGHTSRELGTLAGQFSGSDSPEQKRFDDAREKVIAALRSPGDAPGIRGAKKGRNGKRAERFKAQLEAGWISRTYLSGFILRNGRLINEVMGEMVSAEMVHPEADINGLLMDSQTGVKPKGWKVRNV